MKNLLYIILLLCTEFLYAQEAETAEKEDVNPKEVAFELIEHVPIYKGCDPQLSNEELKKCTSKGISKTIGRHFKYNLANKLKLPEGIERIFVLFKINKEGDVVDIYARASHPALEAEAIRVINLVPKFDRPGMQNDEPVIVPFIIPIVVKVESKKKTKF